MRVTRDFIFDPSLVLYLPLWALDGASFKSKDAYGHLCTRTGALWRPDGHYFDAVDDNISVPDTSSLDITGALTIITWVKRTAASGSHRTFICKGNATTSTVSYAAQWLDSDVINFLVKSGAVGDYVRTTDTFSIDTWYQFAVTRDASNNIVIYVNGVSNKTGSVAAAPSSAGVDLFIGARDLGATQNWGGLVGETLIYNRTLALSEIQHNYLATKWRYR